jgi:thioredoxin reductase (NADPH)
MDSFRKETDVIVVGSGPAGLTCSIYLARFGLLPLVLVGDIPGGQLIKTDIIENYPGYVSISGCELMMNMLNQAENLGVELLYQSVNSISKAKGKLELKLNSGHCLTAKAVVIATGVAHKKLECPGEREFSNKGVSWCATCDGPLLKGKVVAVVGGGNTAVSEALFLAKQASNVVLIHRKSVLRAEQFLQRKLFANHKVECVWNTEIVNICGHESLESIRLRNVIDQSENVLNVAGLFIAVGSIPVTHFMNDLVDLDEYGYVKALDTLTSCDGIFAAGDIVSGSLKQAVFAAGQGALAAKRVIEFLGIE